MQPPEKVGIRRDAREDHIKNALTGLPSTDLHIPSTNTLRIYVCSTFKGEKEFLDVKQMKIVVTMSKLIKSRMLSLDLL